MVIKYNIEYDTEKHELKINGKRQLGLYTMNGAMEAAGDELKRQYRKSEIDKAIDNALKNV